MAVWHLLPLLILVAPRAGGDVATADHAELRQRLAEIQQSLDSGHGQLEAFHRKLLARTGTMSSWEAQTSPAVSLVWMLICAVLSMNVFAGLGMLKAGACRVKNVQHVLWLHGLDFGMATLMWWIFGWAFAFSGPYKGVDRNVKGVFSSFHFKDNNFAGSKSFAGHGFLTTDDEGMQIPVGNTIAIWFFQWSNACLAACIVSGGVAERVHWVPYTIYSFFFNLCIYPIIAAWSWGGGFLANMNIPGMVDRAGSGVVHLTGGIGALVGAILCGSREERWDETPDAKSRVTMTPELFVPHSQPLMAFGTLTMWAGWYGLTCGSTLTLNPTYLESNVLAAQIAMNTTLAAAAAGITACLLRTAIKKKNDLPAMCHGVLGGLVAISASCGSVECGTAFGIGIGAGIIYVMFSALLKVARIDDPADVFAVHAACGMWGLFCALLMDWGAGFSKVHGLMGLKCVGYPDCLDDGKNGSNIAGANFAAIFAIMAWAGFFSLIFFGIPKLAKKLNYTDTEDTGIDKVKHVPIKGYNFGSPKAAQFGLHSV